MTLWNVLIFSVFYKHHYPLISLKNETLCNQCIMPRIFLQVGLSLMAFGLIFFVGHTYLTSQDKYQSDMQESTSLQPKPSMKPQEVVDLQMKAMQKNDYPYENHGIEVAYRFASPENKENTGPIERFTGMVNNEIYRSLLNARQYGLDAIEIEGDIAVQKVTLIDSEDQPVVYFFQLSRQKNGSYKDCWLTDSVVRY